MRGYWAQIWRSVLVWLELGPTERLYLEGAEDLDRVSGLNAETVQVKDTAGNITLRSPDVVEAIDNAFGHQQRNPQRTIRFRFLTTSAAGSEQGAPFRDRMRGIELWRACRESAIATQGEADARAIADFLLAEGKVSAPVQAFLRTASSIEIRQRLISTIEWDTAADDASEVIRAVKDRLVILGEADRVPPESAEAVADHLYATAFATATRREERYLTRAGLLRAFADKTRVSLPATAVAALAAAIPKHLVPEGALALTGGGRSSVIRLPPPLPARYYARTTVLTELTQRLYESAVVVLQGGTGVGKSVSAAGHVPARPHHGDGSTCGEWQNSPACSIRSSTNSPPKAALRISFSMTWRRRPMRGRWNEPWQQSRTRLASVAANSWLRLLSSCRNVWLSHWPCPDAGPCRSLHLPVMRLLLSSWREAVRPRHALSGRRSSRCTPAVMPNSYMPGSRP